MASTGKKRLTSSNNNNGEAKEGILTRVTSTITELTIVQKGKEITSEAVVVGKKLLWSTGKAAWIAGTTLLILGVPLAIESERDASFAEFELQQASLLGAPAK